MPIYDGQIGGDRLNVSIAGNTAGTPAVVSAGTALLAGGSNITLSQVGQNISIIGGGGGGGAAIQGSGTYSQSTGTIQFSNANGVTFGLNTNGVMTASIPSVGGAQTGISGISAGTQLQTVGTLAFADSNGMSFGLSNSSVLTASYTQSTHSHSTAPSGIGAGSQTATSGSVIFSNSNGVSFGLNGSVLTATVATNYQSQGAYLTTAAQSDHSHGNPTLALTNLSGTTASNSAGFTLSLSAGAGDGVNILAAGTQTANTTGTVLFNNANGITFGMSNNSVITASHNAITSQSNQAVSAANGSSAFQTISFADSNGISWGTGTQGLYATVKTDYLTTARASTDAIGLNTAGTNITWTANSSGISINAAGYAGTGTTFAGTNVSASATLNSNGLNLALSAPNAGAGNVSFSAGTVSSALAAITFSNANGVSFGLGTGASAGVMTASVNAGGAGDGYNIVQAGSAGTTGTTWSSLSATVGINGSNGIIVSQNNSNQLVLDGTNFATAVHLEGNTSGNSSVGIQGQAIHLYGGNNVTLSANGSSITISVDKFYGNVIPDGNYPLTVVSAVPGVGLGVTTNSAMFFPYSIDRNWSGNHVMCLLSNNWQTVTGSGQQTISVSFGVYSNNANTLSQISSNSFSLGVTENSVSATVSYPVSGGTNGYTYTTTAYTASSDFHQGFGTVMMRVCDLYFTNTMSLSSGMYWLGFMKRESSSSSNCGISLALGVNTAPGMFRRGFFADANVRSQYAAPFVGHGYFTSTGSAGYGGTVLPGSVIMTGISPVNVYYIPCITFDNGSW